METLEFIYKGKQVRLECKAEEKRLNTIPVFSSEDVENILVMSTSNNSKLVLINKHFVENIDSMDLDAMLLHILTRIRFPEDGSNLISDISVAKWFGFSRMIRLINMSKTNETDRNRRISRLEKALVTSAKVDVPQMEQIINNFQFVESIGG